MTRPVTRPAALALALAASALALPSRRHAVTDDALMLRPDHRIELAARLSKAASDPGLEMAVLTVPRLADHGFDKASGERFATRVFDAWGLGTRERNTGVLLLVAKEDRFVRIELGAGHPRSRDAEMQRVIDGVILPRFKAGEFSLGILGGAKAVLEALAGHPRALEPRRPEAQGSGRRGGAHENLALMALGGLFLLSLLLATMDMAVHGTSGLGWGYLCLLGTLLFVVGAVLGTGRRRGSRSGGGSSWGGGGFSSGGGASGSW